MTVGRVRGPVECDSAVTTSGWFTIAGKRATESHMRPAVDVDVFDNVIGWRGAALAIVQDFGTAFEFVSIGFVSVPANPRELKIIHDVVELSGDTKLRVLRLVVGAACHSGWAGRIVARHDGTRPGTAGVPSLVNAPVDRAAGGPIPRNDPSTSTVIGTTRSYRTRVWRRAAIAEVPSVAAA